MSNRKEYIYVSFPFYAGFIILAIIMCVILSSCSKTNSTATHTSFPAASCKVVITTTNDSAYYQSSLGNKNKWVRSSDTIVYAITAHQFYTCSAFSSKNDLVHPDSISIQIFLNGSKIKTATGYNNVTAQFQY